MKRILKFTTAILLIVAGNFSCGKEEDKVWENIPVEYVKCPCEHETVIKESSLNWGSGSTDNVLMIDISKTDEDKIKELLESEEIRQYLSYEPATEKAIYTFKSESGVWLTVGFICNFPSRYNWEIPVNGIRVSFTGDVFEMCKPIVFIPEHFYFDLVLTSFKIKR
jgi:hypothetical protein